MFRPGDIAETCRFGMMIGSPAYCRTKSSDAGGARSTGDPARNMRSKSRASTKFVGDGATCGGGFGEAFLDVLTPTAFISSIESASVAGGGSMFACDPDCIGAVQKIAFITFKSSTR